MLTVIPNLRRKLNKLYRFFKVVRSLFDNKNLIKPIFEEENLVLFIQDMISASFSSKSIISKTYQPFSRTTSLVLCQ